MRKMELSPGQAILQAFYGNQPVAPEPVARVWRAEIDHHQITIIDPSRETPDGIRRALRAKFGRHRVGPILEGGQ